MADPKMLVLNRNYVLVSKFGHTVRFDKDVPRLVPPITFHEAVAIGAVLADGGDPNVLEDDVKNPAVTDPVERAALLTAAIEQLTLKNEREDFAASGAPHPAAVARELGFKVSKAEINVAVQAMNDAKAGI